MNCNLKIENYKIRMKKKIFPTNSHEKERLHQSDQVYLRLNKAISERTLKQSEHTRFMTEINLQMKKPEHSYELKKDYRELKNLANCMRKLNDSREQSKQYRKKMLEIRNEETVKESFLPLSNEIQKSCAGVQKQKYKLGQRPEKNRILSGNIRKKEIKKRNTKQNLNENYSLEEKLQLFGSLSDEEKEEYLIKIKEIVRTEGGSERKDKYVANHWILENFLDKSSQNIQMLAVKNHYKNIYKKIKKEMIEELIEPSPVFMKNLVQPDDSKKKGRRLRKKQSNLFGKSQNTLTTDFNNFYEKAIEKVDEGLETMKFRNY